MQLSARTASSVRFGIDSMRYASNNRMTCWTASALSSSEGRLQQRCRKRDGVFLHTDVAPNVGRRRGAEMRGMLSPFARRVVAATLRVIKSKCAYCLRALSVKRPNLDLPDT